MQCTSLNRILTNTLWRNAYLNFGIDNNKYESSHRIGTKQVYEDSKEIYPIVVSSMTSASAQQLPSFLTYASIKQNTHINIVL